MERDIFCILINAPCGKLYTVSTAVLTIKLLSLECVSVRVSLSGDVSVIVAAGRLLLGGRCYQSHQSFIGSESLSQHQNFVSVSELE